MKFFKAAIASLVALAGFTEASISKKEFDARLKNGQFDMKTLMAGAKPHSDAAKKMDAQRVLNNNNFAISAQYSIQFLSCFSLTTSYDEIFENAQNNGQSGVLLNMWKNGQAVAEKSFAIFKLCYTSQCDYTQNDPSIEYVIDLNTFVQAFVTYLPDQVEDYCGACQENEDYCASVLYGGYGYGGNAYQNNANAGNSYNNVNYNNVQYQNANYGGRHLHEFESRRLNNNGQVVRQLDCEVCMKYGCIQNNNNNNNANDVYSFSAGAEWLATVSQCAQTGAYLSGNYGGNGNNNNQLYATFICNAEGNGVEIGMFADENCVMYLTNEPYYNYMSYFDQTYIEMTKDIIEFTFTSQFSCANDEIVYTTQDVSGYNYYGNQQWNNNQNQEAAEWCAMLYNNDQGSTPSNMYDCDGSAYNNYYANYNMNNDDNQYKYMYSFYDYDITEENSIDMQAVCIAVKKANGELHTFYNNDNGQMYSYGSKGSNYGSDFVEETGADNVKTKSSSKKSLSGGAKFGIVMLVGVVVGSVIALVIKFRGSSDDKAEPLVEEADGTMA
jgi:hypothetical protein